MTQINLRPYQQSSIDAVLGYWAQGGGNPLVDLATGLGKSVVIAKMTRDLLTAYPDMRVLMLVHVQELVQQNFMALIRLWNEAPAGIYSAGLGRRDGHRQIVFASIQSVYRKARELGPRDLVLIDEAHLVPSGGDGMYRTLLEGLRDQRPDMRVAGFTATPYRLDSGRLDEGTDRLFDETVYSYGVGPGIADGWLSPLISKASATVIDTSGVAKRGGEYIPGALERVVDTDDITRGAVSEMMTFGKDRRSWLVFCTGVAHAHHVREAVRASGITCETITGDTHPGDRARFINEFKAGRIRCLTNANVLTTGFDAPSVDMIAMLRPTLSPGLYVQMVGRGTRLAKDKENCLILDFAGNVRTHGPVDMLEVGSRKKGEGEAEAGVAPTRTCPECSSILHISIRACPDCGYVWPIEDKPKHEAQADAETPILSTERVRPVEEPVIGWEAKRHTKLGSPDSLRVNYMAGLKVYPEWVCVEHDGFARRKAEKWWRDHGGDGHPPATVDEAIERWDELEQPQAILVRSNGKWFDIVGRRFASARAHA